MTKIIIRWITRDEKAIERIRAKFHIPRYTTLNGWSPAFYPHEHRELFEETVRRGKFISYLECDWSHNGLGYSWKV